jgi:hypothetical protein
MKKPTHNLVLFLRKEYINNPEMGSFDMDIAIRDCLTDMLHVGDEYGVNIPSRLQDAQEVYEEELTEEVRAKTGVSP